MLLGETGPNGHGTYFLGYNKPADINTALNVLLPPDCQMPETALCGDSRIRISHAHHMDRAQVVESNHDLASALGCHGISCIAKELSYIDMNNVWVVPIAHAALFGVIKKFWHFVLGESVKKAESDFVLSVEARRRMTARASHFIITNDFNRPYRDIVPCSYWTMEEWLHWTDCFSLYVLHSHGGDPNKVVMPVVTRKDDAGLDREFDLGRMWEMLRTAMLHYLRYDQFSEAACDSAAVTFKQFCCDSELVFGMKFATYNMHLLACRLREQERARGHVAFATEFWVERGVQQVKSGVKFRTTRCPEQIIVSGFLASARLAEMRAERGRGGGTADGGATGPAGVEAGHALAAGGSQYKSFDEWVPDYRAAHVTLTGDVCADVEDGEGSQLLGRGYVAGPTERTVVFEAFMKAFSKEDFATRSGVVEGDLQNASVIIFKRALVRRDQVLLSTKYNLTTARESFYVKTKYAPSLDTPEDDQDVSVYVGEVAFYARVQTVRGVVCRVAICELHKVEVVRPQSLYYAADFSRRKATPNQERQQTFLNSFPVLLQAIDSKVMRCKLDENKSYFITYHLFSQLPTNDGDWQGAVQVG